MREMTEADRLAAARAEMRARGFRGVSSEPPWFRLLLRLGPAHRPPHHRGFWSLLLDMTPFSAVFWGIFMWATRWRVRAIAPGEAILTSAAAGLAYGVTMALRHGLSARRDGLGRWEDLRRPSADPEPSPA